MMWSLLIVVIWAACAVWAFWDVVRDAYRRHNSRKGQR